MRIGIDIRTLMDEKYSGIPEYSLRLIEEMLKQGTKHEFVLFYNSFWDIAERIPDFAGDNIVIKKTRYPNKLFGYILQKSFRWPKINRLLGVDVFFMPHLNFAALTPSAKKVITVHDLSFLIHPEFFSLKKNIWHRSLAVKKELKQFDQIIAVSQNTKRDLVEICDIELGKIEVVYPGIAPNFYLVDPRERQLEMVAKKYNLPKKFILFLGTIEPRKNVDGLIRAYDKLLDENPLLGGFDLVLAGARGWKYQKTIKAWENSKYKEKIHFTSYVDKDDKLYLYNLAQIFVYPSFYEGFGFPPLEAMACGLPVIASANSSLSEVLGDGCLFIDPYDINSLKLAMKELLKSENLQKRLIERGLKNVKKYTWEASGRQVLEILGKTS